MWDLSSLPGIETASPPLEGGLLTTGPPGKSPGVILGRWVLRSSEGIVEAYFAVEILLTQHVY